MAPRAYFDAATAAPLHPAGRQALLAALEDGWADPGKLYSQARRARQLQDAATAATAEVIGVRPEEITFCSSGTEACHRAVGGLLAGRQRVGRLFVHSTVEHSAVLHAARAHVEVGGESVAVPVDRLGRVDLGAFTAAVSGDGVAAAALMSANHEVGTVQPIADAAAACQAAGVPLLVDAAQSLGRVPVPSGWSVLTASAHKWGGPPGVGVVAVRKGVRWPSRRARADIRVPAAGRGGRRGAAGGLDRGGRARRGGSRHSSTRSEPRSSHRCPTSRLSGIRSSASRTS